MILQQIEELQRKAATLLDQAEKAGDLKTTLVEVREARPTCISIYRVKPGDLIRGGYLDMPPPRAIGFELDRLLRGRGNKIEAAANIKGWRCNKTISNHLWSPYHNRGDQLVQNRF